MKFKTLACTVLERMEGRMHNPKPICPINFFKVGGIISKYHTLTFIKQCLNIKQVILAWSGAHKIDDVALKYETNLSRY